MSQEFRFEHEAMKTTYAFRLMGENMAMLQSTATECFLLLEEIEGKLSRYREGSDIWQINHMRAGESLILSELCYNCLKLSFEIYEQSAGLFDITLGRKIEHRKQMLEGPPPELQGKLMLDPERHTIHCIEAGRELDLGGIGKGYALDYILDHLKKWSPIEDGLLAAGASTLLAFGQKSWPVQLTGDYVNRTIELNNRALSASGTEIQGSHIVSPEGEAHEGHYPRIWLFNDSAARADAWSTAAMCMNPEDLDELQSAGFELFVDAPAKSPK